MSGATYRIFKFQKIATYLNKVFLQLTQEERFCIQNRLPSIKQSCLTYVNCRLISLPKIHVITFQNMAENKFLVGYAKMGTSGCKKCKTKIDKGALRIAKVVANPFTSEGGDMKQWHHPACLFETFKRARATTKKIEEPDDMEGFSELKQEDKDELNKLIKDFLGNQKTPTKKTPAKNKTTPAKMTPVKSTSPEPEASTSNSSASTSENPNGKGSEERDNAFREFRRLCADIAEHSSYLDKTALVNKFLKKGSSGDGFKGDTYLWLKLLLPGVVKRVYNLNSKQLVKLFSQIFGTNLEEMVADLDQGDVAETVRQAFDQSVKVIPMKKSTLSLQQVDSFLDQLTTVTKEDDQQRILLKVAKLCTVNDLKMFVRLIKHDLRINAGAKHILDALDPNAYAAFQSSRDLKDVVERVLENHAESNGNPAMKKKLSVRASLMTPVLPMLAEACRSVDYAMKKCPNGFYAEIKYDGERVQLHKRGDDFQFFSRSLKPVLPHKVNHFKEFIPEAFPSGDNLILDAEVLLVDTNTSKPLPFGTLGVHKKAQFHDAQVCLFVFDCLHINGENIMNKPIQERRKILHENMKEIKNRVMFSEMQFMKNPIDLQDLMDKVFSQGLEGLVLKDIKGIYEPGKRHWLKIKKDYLEQGTMADSADLVVLGAYYGSGNKGGIMSIFLLGAYDPATNKWCTVTKCHSGLDDKTLDRLQTELDMVKISKDASKVPSWLNIKKQVVPDFVCKDPKDSPVWEISGAEFSKAEIHTADGISIRFPRITKFRDDKSWKEATDLPQLKVLFAKSKEVSDIKGSPMKKKPSLSTDSKSSDNTTETSNQSWSVSSPVKTSVSSPPVSPFKGGNLNDWVKRGNKRSSNSADGEDSEHGASPVKKSKPQCRYGSECYQTNPSHLDKYDHPASASLPKAKLPDIFKGLKIYVPENTPEYRKLKRYIIAYDGDLVPDYQAKEADIIIVKDKPFPGGRKCVKTQWLWDSVKKKTQLDTTKYLVK